MPAGWLRCLPWVTGLTLLAAAGAGAAGVTGEEAGAEQARGWLARLHAAARTSNYRGTLVSTAAGTMSSSRVWHYCAGDDSFQKIEAMDGQQRQVVGHNDEVLTLWPQSRVAMMEKREALSGWPPLPQSLDPRLIEQYRVLREGTSRLAGRDAEVFVLEPRDALRYAQRLWSDRSTGLMLRADVLDAGNPRPVLQSTAFSEVQISDRPPPRALMQPVAPPEGWRVVRPRVLRTRLEDEGWTLARPVSGFALTGCIKRALDAVGAGVDEPVLQAVFSDGLTHVSLFVEHFDRRRPRVEVNSRHGATTTLAVRRLDHWFTAVGDAPAATLRQLIESLERRR